jgi:hypothetical protein
MAGWPRGREGGKCVNVKPVRAVARVETFVHTVVKMLHARRRARDSSSRRDFLAHR